MENRLNGYCFSGPGSSQGLKLHTDQNPQISQFNHIVYDKKYHASRPQQQTGKPDVWDSSKNLESNSKIRQIIKNGLLRSEQSISTHFDSLSKTNFGSSANAKHNSMQKISRNSLANESQFSSIILGEGNLVQLARENAMSEPTKIFHVQRSSETLEAQKKQPFSDEFDSDEASQRRSSTQTLSIVCNRFCVQHR